MIYGYMRPLIDDPECIHQLQNQQIDSLYKEAHGSAKNREVLDKLFLDATSGDIIIVERLAILADSLHHLEDVLYVARKDNITIHFVKEQFSSTSIEKCSLLQLTGHFTLFQTEIVRQATKLGLAKAQQSGVVLGRPRKPDDKLQKAMLMYHSGQHSLREIKDETGISKSTLYRYLETEA
ncbi:recombinase family protein [Paenibacillus yanchengensis]|uniref:Recombinase family protein n=1 Tax=Paenibacillus yanchengensis TaxID=2035833 RepID=A0ABW4YIM3_9BACL